MPCSGKASAEVEELGGRTEGFSGSDLMELCSQAAQHVLNDYWLQQRWVGGGPSGCSPWVSAWLAGSVTGWWG